MAYSNTPAAASGCCSLLLMLGKQKDEVVILKTSEHGRRGVVCGQVAHQHVGDSVLQMQRERINYYHHSELSLNDFILIAYSL